jgi:hypothetical protein
MVMTNPRLNIKAKGIYAYFCVWTGSGNSAFPSKENILKYLGISHNTYQRYYKQLIDINYITVLQRRDSGRMAVNDYYLNDNPDVDCLPNIKISDTENTSPDTIFSDTEISDININNELTINNIISSSSSEGVLDMTTEELAKLIKAVSLEDLNEEEEERNKFEGIYEIFITTLNDLCYISHMQYSGLNISNVQIMDKLWYVTGKQYFNDFCKRVISDYYFAKSTREIKSVIQYMRSCIYNVMLLGDGIKIEKDMSRKDRGVRDLGHQEKKNAFQSFPQREFDYDTLVLAEINKGFYSVK